MENNMKMSEQINELASALSKAQGEMKHAFKGSHNPFYNSKYADLVEVWDTCREVLSKNNLAVIQTTEEVEKDCYVITTLAHSSGQWIQGRLKSRLMPDKLGNVKETPQTIGSGITYARRYALMAIVGVASSMEDDDGNAASGIKVDENGTAFGYDPYPDIKALMNKILDGLLPEEKRNLCKDITGFNTASEIRSLSIQKQKYILAKIENFANEKFGLDFKDQPK